jgi:hypothetical protein
VVTKISDVKQTQKVYDLVEVKSANHQYYTNGFVSKNCDEIAFIPNRFQEEFMSGTTPALSATKGKMLITSTPNGSRDLFAKLWFGSGMTWDKKQYTYVRKNEPKNLFSPLFVPFWIDPEKNTDEWIHREKMTLDSPIAWKIEFECMYPDTLIDVYDEKTKNYQTITIEDMYRMILRDEIENKVIIDESDN